MLPIIWASFARNFVAKNFKKSPNLVTLRSWKKNEKCFLLLFVPRISSSSSPSSSSSSRSNAKPDLSDFLALASSPTLTICQAAIFQVPSIRPYAWVRYAIGSKYFWYKRVRSPLNRFLFNFSRCGTGFPRRLDRNSVIFSGLDRFSTNSNLS